VPGYYPAGPVQSEPGYAPEAPATPKEARFRTLVSGGTVFLGGYLVLFALSNGVVNQFSGIGGYHPAWIVFFVSEILVAVGVVVLGLLLAPTSTLRKALASGIVLAIPVVEVFCAVAIVKAPPGNGFLGATFANFYFMTVLAVGAAWLIVRRASIGWLTLLLTGGLIALAIAVPSDQDFPVWLIARFVASGIVGGVILVAGWPRRP
jgi:hypothetical protein